MFRKFIVSLSAAAAFVLVFSAASFAQLAPVSGSVEMDKDGVRTPVAGALIEVYRIDIKAGSSPTKTDKKGFFQFAGLPIGGSYTLSVSAPGASPTAVPNIRAGQDKILIIMGPGNGNKYTEEEIRKGIKPPTPSDSTGVVELTAEQKKAMEAYEKEKAEVEAKNAKILKAGEIVNASLKAGNEAMGSKNYDLAIAKYSEGIEAQPNFIGSTPVLLNNRGLAYDNRAVETFNKNSKVTDTAARSEAFARVKEDLSNSVASYRRALEIYQTAPASDIQNPQMNEENKLRTLNGAREVLRHAVITELIDPSVIDGAKLLMPEYEKVETDPAKKKEAGLILADIYRVAQDRENAIEAYKKVLETSPDNVDALAGVGLVLVDLSWLKDNDKAMAQEGANYLQKFVSMAPDTHKLKVGAKEYLELLKAQSIVPVKTTTPAKKRN